MRLVVTGTHFSRPNHRRRPARRRCAIAQGRRPKVALRHRLSPQPLWRVLPATPPARSRFIASSGRVTRCGSRPCLADCDLIVGYRRRNSHRRRRRPTRILCAPQVSARWRRPPPSSSSAAPMGCVVFPRPYPRRSLDAGIRRQGLSRSRFTTSSAPAMHASWRDFLRGWLRGEPRRRFGGLGQCLRRLRGVSPSLLARIRPGPSSTHSSAPGRRAAAAR